MGWDRTGDFEVPQKCEMDSIHDDVELLLQLLAGMCLRQVVAPSWSNEAPRWLYLSHSVRYSNRHDARVRRHYVELVHLRSVVACHFRGVY